MQKVALERTVQAPAHIAYEVVKRVDLYPEFLPLVQSIQETTIPSGPSVNSSQENSYLVDISILGKTYQGQASAKFLTDEVSFKQSVGPLKSLSGQWNIKSLASESTQLTFYCEVKFLARGQEFIFRMAKKKLLEQIESCFSRRILEMNAII